MGGSYGAGGEGKAAQTRQRPNGDEQWQKCRRYDSLVTSDQMASDLCRQKPQTYRADSVQRFGLTDSNDVSRLDGSEDEVDRFRVRQGFDACQIDIDSNERFPLLLAPKQ